MRVGAGGSCPNPGAGAHRLASEVSGEGGVRSKRSARDSPQTQIRRSARRSRAAQALGSVVEGLAGGPALALVEEAGIDEQERHQRGVALAVGADALIERLFGERLGGGEVAFGPDLLGAVEELLGADGVARLETGLRGRLLRGGARVEPGHGYLPCRLEEACRGGAADDRTAGQASGLTLVRGGAGDLTGWL